MADTFNAWWMGAPVLQADDTGTFAAWWQGAPVLQKAPSSTDGTSPHVPMPVEWLHGVRSGRAPLPLEYSPLSQHGISGPDAAALFEVGTSARSGRGASLRFAWRTSKSAPHVSLKFETLLLVRSGRVACPLDVNGRNPLELLLEWNEYRSLDQAFFLIWNETSLGLDQTFPLEWIEKDLLGALDLTWREIPVGMTDLLGQVQRPYGRATKTPNP